MNYRHSSGGAYRSDRPGRDNGAGDRIAIVGGGPAGYESALVAAQLGAEVTVSTATASAGRACSPTACPARRSSPPATASPRSATRPGSASGTAGADVAVDLAAVNERIKDLARQQSDDIEQRLRQRGRHRAAPARGRFAAGQPAAPTASRSLDASGRVADTVEADVVLLATGGTPRVLPTAVPDGERILSWRDVYELKELPEHLVVIGSGVTGAEFASGYSELGVPVTLVSSRDRVLPGEDPDAAAVIEQVFTSRGGTLVKQARAAAVRRAGDGVVVDLVDGRTVHGSHALMCVGSVPNVDGLGLEHVGVALDANGYIARRPGLAHLGALRSTPPATAPACCCSPRWPACRAASRCGTRSARRSPRCGSRRSRPTSSPIPRSRPSARLRPRSRRARCRRGR